MNPPVRPQTKDNLDHSLRIDNERPHSASDGNCPDQLFPCQGEERLDPCHHPPGETNLRWSGV